MTVTYTTDGGLVGVSFLSAAEGGSGGLDGGFGGGGGLPSFGRTMLAELTSSLILDEGTGGPTWSRATKAWGFNELGYFEELASGCAFFGGARLVRNTIRTTSEDFSNAAWAKVGGITTPSANVVVCANATSAQYINQSAGGTSLTAGTRMAYSYRVKRVVGGVDFLQIVPTSSTYSSLQFVNISLVDGSYSATGCSAAVTAVSADTFDVTVFPTVTVTGGDICSVAMINAITDVRLPSFIGDGVKSFELLRAWSVDVTGYDASYVPEYVSVGVEASPYFGAGIDGAKYFETDWQGAPIAAANLLGFRREAAAINNLLHSRDLTNKAWQVLTASGSELLANGTFDADITGWTDSNNSVSSWSAGTISVVYYSTASGAYATFSTTVGKSYTVSAEVVSATGYSASHIIRCGNGSSPDAGLVDSSAFTAPGTKTVSFVATGTTSYVYLRSASGVTVVWDNVTAKESAIQPTKTATGLDGIANTATTLTATAADAIILQPITLASAARCASAYVERRTGTGTISFTQDGGSTWTDITAQINGSTWSRVQITSTLANPSVGFKISTSGDEIDVDCVQNEAGAKATSPIVTTTATITRNADYLAYQTAGNIDFAVGTLYGEILTPPGSSTRYIAGVGTSYSALTSTAVNTWRANDGTNTVTASGLSDVSLAKRKRVVSWGPAGLSSGGDGLAPVTGSFDGSFGDGATISIGANSNGYVGPVAIYNYQMTDAELQAITT